MTLTLVITNRNRLENGSPTELVLHGRSAIIGRAQTCEWPLPDDARVLSGRHCEVQFRDGAYTLVDLSTNGTFLADAPDRMSEPRRIRHGDRFRLGPYELEARLSGEARAQQDAEIAAASAASKSPSWSDWDDFPGGAPAQSPPAAPFAGGGGWDLAGEAREEVSAWADRSGSNTGGPSADQIFNSLTDNHKVDWSSAAWDVAPGFDPFAIPAAPAASATSQPLSPTPQPMADPFGGPINAREQATQPPNDPFGALDPGGFGSAGQPHSHPSPSADPPFSTTPPSSSPSPSPLAAAERWSPHAGEHLSAPVPPAMPIPASAPVNQPGAGAQSGPATTVPDAAYRELIAALGVSSASLTEPPEASAARAGRMLRRLLAGLMILLEARARAKDEMGASATQLRFDGNNPLKFARNVEQALQMMMNPAMQGYMEADNAIEDSYRDLQAHQIATLRAMQGALRATLQRFSPASIKARIGDEGVLSKLLPGKREAALWRAYEKQFSGVAEGSAEAFLEIFSKEFRQAYEDAARGN